MKKPTPLAVKVWTEPFRGSVGQDSIGVDKVPPHRGDRGPLQRPAQPYTATSDTALPTQGPAVALEGRPTPAGAAISRA